MVFLIKHVKRGGHIHCALFAAKQTNQTFAKCGDFTIREEEFDSMRGAMSGVSFRDGDEMERRALEEFTRDGGIGGAI